MLPTSAQRVAYRASTKVLIETAFYDGELLVCKMVLRVFYD